MLANEQVIDGRGWRSGGPGRAPQARAMVPEDHRIRRRTAGGAGELERWPERVRLMQENWIGRSEGARVLFRLAGRDDRLEVFTTRPDTLFGASFCAIAADHPLAVERAAADDPRLRRSSPNAALAEQPARRRSKPQEKRGYDTGLRALHPFDAEWQLPVYVANFVLTEYGTGAIFGCPGARSARSGVRPHLWPAGRAGRRADGRRCRRASAIGDEAYTGPGPADQLPISSTAWRSRRPRRRSSGGWRPTARRRRHQLSAARLGRIAPALLGLPDSDPALPRLRHRAGARGRSAGDACPRMSISRPRAIRSTGTRPGSTSPARTAAVPARSRDRHLRYLLRILLVLRPLLLAARTRARSIVRPSITGCRSISTSAASSTRSCTCSTRASSPARCSAAAISASTSRSPG